MKKPFISGIQQVGIGVSDVHEAWSWYREHLQVDVPIFEEKAEARLMLPYTGGKPRSRHAVLALNLNGGGGFEIWQYVGRTPQPAEFEIKPGDLGINAIKIKSFDVKSVYDQLSQSGVHMLSRITKDPAGQDHFYFQDPYGNPFEIVHSENWFNKKRQPNGGVGGVVIGVSNMEASMDFYKSILGYDKVIYDTDGPAADMEDFDQDQQSFRRVLLERSAPVTGPFSGLLGDSSLELIQTKSREPHKIFKNRFWGDLGYIHLCFDIIGMDEMRIKCEKYGTPFTVDSSNQFDMGEAAGHFSYIEDPDGTLIEFVETHKIPVLKKLGWYLNLLKRDRTKRLPKYMLRALSLNRVKK
ncbi:VOC family protein [Membranicola marinus]|uniref:VOC family protein n=1 Tax=Membranihabitans marinus TaxID=1227546 RepID=A0A953HXA3_9BACT|nr:VOC family protein [Membranihabitans marinus]MBY5958321.1 VOC family protein [Membranihabitans marinus]